MPSLPRARASRARGWLIPASLVASLAPTLVAPGLLCAAEPALKGLPPITAPADNPQSPEKIALGRQLYFDRRLSLDNTVACADCHNPDKGFSNGDQFATGIKGQKGGRNSPTVLNTAFQKFQFWDGRADTLEQQALGPIANPIEMGLPLPEMEARLNKIPGYREQFRKVFGAEAIVAKDVAKAIASYERTAVTAPAPYDRFTNGELEALSEPAREGRALFFGKANCSACHGGPNFTDNGFHNIGVGMQAEKPDIGREAISKLEGDRGAFKTPTLRNIARTGPYMHDGSLKTLAEVVEHYDRGGVANEWLDEEIYALRLTPREKAALVKFLEEGLSGPVQGDHKPPQLPE
jgi:cytochrome c peroxidase